MEPDTKPAIVITGASRGLGALIARRLAAGRHEVFAGMRTPPPAPPGAGFVPLALDVTDPASVAAAAAAVSERVGGAGIAALVNNAAVLEAGPLEYADRAKIERHLTTNVTGPLATTQAFLPLLRAGHGRIINVSTVNAELPLPYWGLYSASKAALDTLSDTLRMELAPWDIGVTIVTLGAFATDIRRRAVAAWAPQKAYASARATTEALVAMLDATAADPERVADAIVDILNASQAPARVAVGDGIEDLLALAAQPAEVRQAAIEQLLSAARGAAAA